MASNVPREHMGKSLAKLFDWLDGTVGVQTSHTVSTTAGFKHYETAFTTDGTGTQAVAMPASPGVQVGKRKLFTLASKGANGDTVVFAAGSFSKAALAVSAVVLSAVNDFLLVEYRGSKWEVIAASNGVVTAA